jgi:GGDEF domain-containing protein
MALKVNWAIPVDRDLGRPSISPVEPLPYPHRPRRLGPPEDGGGRDRSHAVRRAGDAILGAVDTLDLFDPMLPSALRFAEDRGERLVAAPLLASWKVRAAGGPDRARRFPWSLGHDALPSSSATESPDGRGALWRSRERDWLDRGPTAFAGRLLTPIAIAENLAFLHRLTTDANQQIAGTATEILRDVQPLAEGDIADFIRGDDPWRDTFALWQLARRPAALELLRELALAIAMRSGTLASRLAGLPCGTRFPFEAVPLVSASAHLGLGLWALGYRPSLLPGLIDFVASREHRSGGWGDDGQPADVLTTLAAAELLGSLDPSFGPAATIDFFVRHQESSGWWRALDPEVPWLTAAIAGWLEGAERPFHERFAWPRYARTDLDRKTGVPGFAAFDALDRLFRTLPGIGAAPIEMAFGDLAGFRAFNNRCGQETGDAVLRLFAQHLRSVPGAIAIRDGGDEFLVIGAPTRRDLAADIDASRATWPDLFRARFGTDVPMVVPRFVVATSQANRIAALREWLGREIGLTKDQPLDEDGHGLLRIVGEAPARIVGEAPA